MSDWGLDQTRASQKPAAPLHPIRLAVFEADPYLTSGWGVPQTDSPNRRRTALLDSAEKGSGLFVLWWGEHDAEEHMVGQEYQTLHRPRMPGLRQPQQRGDARLETGQHH